MQMECTQTKNIYTFFLQSLTSILQKKLLFFYNMRNVDFHIILKNEKQMQW